LSTSSEHSTADAASNATSGTITSLSGENRCASVPCDPPHNWIETSHPTIASDVPAIASATNAIFALHSVIALTGSSALVLMRPLAQSVANESAAKYSVHNGTSTITAIAAACAAAKCDANAVWITPSTHALTSGAATSEKRASRASRLTRVHNAF